MAIAEAVPVQPETAANRPACLAAHDTCAGPGALYRRRRREPPLDVERMMNDSWSAFGRLQRDDREHDVGGGENTVGVTYGGEPYAQLRNGRS